MKNNSLWLALLFGSVSNFALAGGIDSVAEQPMRPEQSDWSWVAAVSAGSAWESFGQTQTFYLTPEIEKSYRANKSTEALFVGEVFFGIQKTLSQTFQGQLGVALLAADSADLNGVIWDDADPIFDNFVYKYKIQHTHVTLKGKLLGDANLWLTPWVSGGVGVGFNNSHGYQGTPVIYEAVPTPDFPSHTETTFVYTVGAGVQKTLNEHWQIGLGYEFADWGKSQLRRAAEQTLNRKLTIDHLYTNSILLSIIYAIP